MADADKLQPYTPRQYPNIEGGVPRYITQEMQRISTAISSIKVVLKDLEARIAALGG